MRVFVIAAVLSTGALLSGTAYAQEALAKSSGCLNCHNVDATKKMGPGFKEIAAKYKGQADAEGKLVTALTQGKGHPAVKVSEADAKSLVKYVLAQ
jgi:cytochrome c